MLKANNYPQYIKYMGSKSKIIDFVVDAINDLYDGGGVCDLFAGSCSLSGAIGKQVQIYSNDIQNYSATLADAYLNCWKNGRVVTSYDLLKEAECIVAQNMTIHNSPGNYGSIRDIESFVAIENKARNFINEKFTRGYHLFAKYYSGTWWSWEQCLWIDALKEVADRYRETSFYSVIISSLMYAMAYCGQGTGHYAQYRDAKDASSLNDILIYRNRSVPDYFKSKYDFALEATPTTKPSFSHQITSMDYLERLTTLPRCTIYADPPYCFVHYSRFYHAIETLVLYDYPEIQLRSGNYVKGRYRTNRHQSPFCIKTKVEEAFVNLLEGVKLSNSNLVLSYSNSGMITLSRLKRLIKITMTDYVIDEKKMDHRHMTMGRLGDRSREVKEVVITARKK